MNTAIESRPLKPYHGIVVPMVTPANPEGELDGPAVRRVVDHLIAGGIAGVFVLGTTGEDASIHQSTRSSLVTLVVEQVARRALVYAGISSNSLTNSVTMANEYMKAGADVLVARLPTYYVLGPEEQFDYFEKLAFQVRGPLMIYNIPATTHMSISIDVIEKLSHLPKVVGVKDSEYDPSRLEALIRRFDGRDAFSIFVGAGPLIAKGLTLGADGAVPSAGNLIPKLFQALSTYSPGKSAPHSEKLQQTANRFAEIYQRNRSLGQSLAALKACMVTQGLCGLDVFPPLRRMSQLECQQVQQEFRDLLESTHL